jgi:hypothetical protein
VAADDSFERAQAPPRYRIRSDQVSALVIAVCYRSDTTDRCLVSPCYFLGGGARIEPATLGLYAVSLCFRQSPETNLEQPFDSEAFKIHLNVSVNVPLTDI